MTTKYSLLYVDPPWSYGNTISNGAAAERCEECDEPIPEPRRAAVPGCQTCAECHGVIELRNKQRGA